MKTRAVSFLLRELIKIRPRLSQICNFGAYYTARNLFMLTRPIYNPISAGIVVEGRCNFNCEFCSAGVPQMQLPGLSMNIESFYRFIDHPAVKSVLRVSFLGGEPLLNKDVFKMIFEANRRKHLTTMFSNGSLVKNRLFELLDSKLNFIGFSLYDEHESLTLENTSLLIDSVKKRKKRLFISLQKIFNKNTYLQMEKTIKQAIEIGIDGLYLQNIFATDDNPLALRKGNHDYLNYVESLKTQYSNKLDITFPILINSSANYNNCNMLWQSLLCDGYGNLQPCCFIYPSRKFGNIFENVYAWNSPIFDKLRHQLETHYFIDRKYCVNCAVRIHDVHKL